MRLPPAFRSRPFLFYWIGHLVSIIGSQMQLWALYWHLRTLSDQPMVISGIGLARFIPLMLLSLAAGVAADRFNRRILAIITQFALGLVALTLGLTTAWKAVSLWVIFGLVVVQAAAVAFDGPARQALIPSLVPREHLANAYSLNSIGSKVGGILGPAICGFVLAFWGLQWAYWLNAISYLAVIGALIGIGRIADHQKHKTHRNSNDFDAHQAGRFRKDVSQGIDFIKHSPIIQSAMFLDFFGTFFSSANTLLPFVARDLLNVGPIAYGWLSSGQAIGTILVALYVSQTSKLKHQGKLMSLSVVMLGVATIIFGISRSFWLTLLSLILIGGFDGLSSIIRNTIRQLLTPDEMRGRMMSITQIFFKGGPQLGEVESGLVAQLLSVPAAIITGGIGCVLAACLVISRIPQLWRYEGVEVELVAK